MSGTKPQYKGIKLRGPRGVTTFFGRKWVYVWGNSSQLTGCEVLQPIVTMLRMKSVRPREQFRSRPLFVARVIERIRRWSIAAIRRAFED